MKIGAGFFVFLAVLSAGCDQLNNEEPDFGASVVARYIQAARVKCDAAEVPELWECAELGREKKEAWLAARSALDSYEAFKSGCYPAAGMTKCESMIEKALLKTPRPQRAAERPVGSTAL